MTLQPSSNTKQLGVGNEISDKNIDLMYADDIALLASSAEDA